MISKGATLRQATLRQATLHYGTTLSYAKLRYAKLRQAMPSYATLSYATPSYASSATVCRYALPMAPSPPIRTAQRMPPTNHNGTAPQNFAQTTPIQANPKGPAHRAPRERPRTPVRTNKHISKVGTNTVPPPDPTQKREPFPTHSGTTFIEVALDFCFLSWTRSSRSFWGLGHLRSNSSPRQRRQRLSKGPVQPR